MWGNYPPGAPKCFLFCYVLHQTGFTPHPSHFCPSPVLANYNPLCCHMTKREAGNWNSMWNILQAHQPTHWHTHTQSTQELTTLVLFTEEAFFCMPFEVRKASEFWLISNTAVSESPEHCRNVIFRVGAFRCFENWVQLLLILDLWSDFFLFIVCECCFYNIWPTVVELVLRLREWWDVASSPCSVFFLCLCVLLTLGKHMGQHICSTASQTGGEKVVENNGVRWLKTAKPCSSF